MSLRSLAPAGVPFSLADIVAATGAALRGGEALGEFRSLVARTFDQPHVFCCSSGRGAISMALGALKELHPGRDEVLVPAYTSFSVPSAVVHAGCKVRLYDLDPETMSPDLASLEAGLSDKTLCVLVCHLFGYPADMDPIVELCRERGVVLFDDAAQAMGASYKGRQAGTMGDIGLYSLSRGKNISAVDGGILVTGDARLAEVLERLEVPAPGLKEKIKLAVLALALCVLLHPRMYWIPRSLPFLKLGASVFDPEFEVVALTAFQAGLAMRMLRRLPAINLGRDRAALALKQRFAGREFPRPVDKGEPVFLRMPLLDAAADEPLPDLGVVRSYPTALDRVEGLGPHLVGEGVYPGATRLAENILTLPTHGYVSEADMDGMAAQLQPGGGRG